MSSSRLHYFATGEPNVSRFDSVLLTEMSLIVIVIDFKLSLTVAKISFRNQHQAQLQSESYSSVITTARKILFLDI